MHKQARGGKAINKDKKYILGGIQKFSIEDGPGIRTTVFTKGCPLACKWCHNPELIDFEKQVLWNPEKCIGDGECLKVCETGAMHRVKGTISMNREKCTRCMKCTEVCYSGALAAIGIEMTVDEVMHVVMQDLDFYKNTRGGLTISGGEILSNFEFTYELAVRAKENGINVAMDTSGYGDYSMLFKLAELGDHILYDMKHIGDGAHIALTGKSNRMILKFLSKMAANPDINKKIIMRMPMIKGINDDEVTIYRTMDFYKKNNLKHVNLLPYHNLGVSKNCGIGNMAEEYDSPEDSRMQEIKKLYLSNGIRTTIMGEKV